MMPVLLQVQVSPRPQSVSRTLADRYASEWRKAHPGGDVITRDLAETDVGHVGRPWVGAAFTPAGQRSAGQQAALAQSDELIAELVAADQVVIGTPMYNFGVPAVLKAWMDQVVRAFVTYSPQGGLLADRPVTAIIASRDIYTQGSPLQSSDFAGPWLRRIFAYIGITDVEVILAGGSLGVRTGQVTFEDHVATFLPAVIAAATASPAGLIS